MTGEEVIIVEDSDFIKKSLTVASFWNVHMKKRRKKQWIAADLLKWLPPHSFFIYLDAARRKKVDIFSKWIH